VNYTSQQFRLQAAMCLEIAAAQADEELRRRWLASAEHLLTLSTESARTLSLVRAVTQGAEATEFQTESHGSRETVVAAR
jgi:hypothetical protein